jgi:hypothetical protein
MAIPGRIQMNMVDLANLQIGVRYTFTQPDNPGYIYEGTFTELVPPSPANNGNAQYFFSNINEYNTEGKLIENISGTNFSRPNDYPRDIFVYDLPNLPNELNQYIRNFGGKSRKTKSRRNTKLKRRRNRKSKKR